MSSAEATTKACSLCLDSGALGITNGSGTVMGSLMMSGHGPETMQQMDNMRAEINQLKNDKLDLLRQNVVSI